MHVSIKYPDQFRLTGWGKGMFDLRVTGMFRRKWVDICALDACRKQLELEDASETQLHADLHELHCVSFRKIPLEVLEELPAKISEYLGVEVRRSYRLPLVTIAGWAATVLMIAGLAWGALKVFNKIEAEKRERISHVTLESAIPFPAQQSEIALPLMENDFESSKILKASVTTSSPAKTMHQLANSITESGKKFDVVVTVTRLDD